MGFGRLAISRMKFFAVLFIAGVAQSGLVRREADAEAKADPGHYAAASQPICRSVPEKTCTPRNIEKPKQVCHDEYDKIVDTTITEHCEEVITTKCEQDSQHSRHSSGVIGHDSKVVATGVAASAERVVSYGHISSGVGSSYSSDAGYGYTSGHTKSAPLCTSVPQKMCKQVPIDTPRKVKKTLCKTVVDVTTIEDCKEVITTHCEQTSQKVAHHSAVVGHDTRVGPASVVDTQSHAVGVVSSYGAGVGVISYGSSVGGITRFGGYGRY